MPRKKKVNTAGQMTTITLAKDVLGTAVERMSGMKWVTWGLKNDYPNRLLELYTNSPTHKACVDFEVMSIIGNGVDTEQMQIEGSDFAPNEKYSWDTLIRSVALDYSLYGSFAIEIIPSKDKTKHYFYHLPFDKVRYAERNEDGEVESYFVCSDWKNYATYPPVQIADISVAKEGERSLLVHNCYSPSTDYYPTPKYIAGIKAIQSEIEHQNFDFKSTTNSFVPAGMLTLPYSESDEERKAVIKNIQNMFTGSENANSLMISFQQNPEEVMPSFTPFQAAQTNVDLFEASNKRTVSRILASHQIPNSNLIGVPAMDSTGFNSEGAFLEASYTLYNALVGNTSRLEVFGTINDLLSMNGYDTEIIVKPLKFSLEEQSEETNDLNNTENVRNDSNSDGVGRNDE